MNTALKSDQKLYLTKKMAPLFIFLENAKPRSCGVLRYKNKLILRKEQIFVLFSFSFNRVLGQRGHFNRVFMQIFQLSFVKFF